MNANAEIIPAPILNAAKVIAFAKENGFPDAQALYWDDDNPEYGQLDLESLVDHDGSSRVRCGIELGHPPFEVTRDSEGDLRFV